MALTPFLALVRKDLQLFFSDRRAVIMGFAAPIAIASFFGSIFGGPQTTNEPARIAVAIVDADSSEVSRAIAAAAGTDKNLRVATLSLEEGRESVKRGRMSVAVVIPKGFGDEAGRALFSAGEPPALTFLYDPSKNSELAVVRGVMVQHIMESVSDQMFATDAGQRVVDEALANVNRDAMPEAVRQQLLTMLASARQLNALARQDSSGRGRRGMQLPYAAHEEAVTSSENVPYNGFAHSFAGMGVQFVLFSAIELGIGVLLERQRGLWKRLRAAPLSRLTLLGSRTASGAVITLLSLLVSFGFAMMVFRVRIQGSLPGFAAVAICTALMASAFGLLIASLGKTPGGTRGIAIFSTLMMVMLGGAWVPTFLFPSWLQQVTLLVPVRWAVDGLDAMTWRGLGFRAALMPVAALLGFAALFATVAVARFRWEEA